MDENSVIEQRKEKFVKFFREKYSWVYFAILAVIVWLSAYIRTRGLPGLRDVTTGTWTLGPDLDPFLFLRWAKYIVQNGSLMSMDWMRYPPLGFDTRFELIFLPYLIAWFHKVSFAIGLTTNVEHSAVLYPVFMFAITVIAFFFFVRKTFSRSFEPVYSNAIALIACLFLSIIPVFLPRTIAGIPEKESSAFFFMFMSFYFFVCGWQVKNFKKSLIFGVCAGAFGAGMALIWGGYSYLLISIGLAILVADVLKQVDKKRLVLSLAFVVTMYVFMDMFSTRYSLLNLAVSTTTLFPIAVMFISAINVFGKHTIYERTINKIPGLNKVPAPLASIVVVVLLGVIFGAVVFGPHFILDVVKDLFKPLITPVSDRLGVTVAENQQPYFTEWASNFGPEFGSVPIFFWITFIGSVYLFYHIVDSFSVKERNLMTAGFTVFLLALVFSRYSAASVLNGVNFVSLATYIIGALVFVGIAGFYYYQRERTNNLESLHSVSFELILVFSFLLLSFVSARGAVRVILMLVPPASIVVGVFIVSLIKAAVKNSNSSRKNLYYIALAVLVLASIYSAFYFYKVSYVTAQNYIPSSYTQQWQFAMKWVRENTATNAVFGHWWDYGYWVQTMGQRATVLDGGNAIPYWNHLMGRYALTGNSSAEAAEFLYSHNTTHFLIDSSDIGKYTAFSSIGSDEEYDRRSWISTFILDNSQTQEGKNSTVTLYRGGFTLDEDLTYDENGTQDYLPGLGSSSTNSARSLAGLGGILISRGGAGEILSVRGVFVYNGRQYNLPIRYAYYKGKFIDLGQGIDAGIFLMDVLNDGSNGQMSLTNQGAVMYLSSRTLHSQLARLYLFNQTDPYFTKIYDESDYVVKSLRQQGFPSDEFIFYNGVRGPISIWEVHYQNGMKVNPEFTRTDYPDIKLKG